MAYLNDHNESQEIALIFGAIWYGNGFGYAIHGVLQIATTHNRAFTGTRSSAVGVTTCCFAVFTVWLIATPTLLPVLQAHNLVTAHRTTASGKQ